MTPRWPSQTRIPYALFAILLLLDVVVLLIEKTAALRAAGGPQAFYLGVVQQPWLWCGLALGPIQLWIWTTILSRTELSLAYPVSSLSYPLTMVAAQLMFKEHLSYHVWLGALGITAGVALVSRPPARQTTSGRQQPLRYSAPECRVP